MSHSGCTAVCDLVLLMQGPSSDGQFFAEFAKPAEDYLAGLPASAVQQAPADAMIMDNSLSTWAFYWSAGESAQRELLICLLTSLAGPCTCWHAPHLP